MTVTLYSITPPTKYTSQYLLRPTLLNGAESKPLPVRSERLPMHMFDLGQEGVSHAPIRSKPLMQDATDGAYHPVYDHPWVAPYVRSGCFEPGVLDHQTHALLQDIDDWYSSDIEDDGFLEQLDRSAESIRFP